MFVNKKRLQYYTVFGRATHDSTGNIRKTQAADTTILQLCTQPDKKQQHDARVTVTTTVLYSLAGSSWVPTSPSPADDAQSADKRPIRYVEPLACPRWCARVGVIISRTPEAPEHAQSPQHPPHIHPRSRSTVAPRTLFWLSRWF